MASPHTGDPAAKPVRVILLAGPSGTGKSYLAARLRAKFDIPVIRLDDFYHDVDAPELPRSPLGIVDWDHPGSWNADTAHAALSALCLDRRTELPVYDIPTSRRTGSRELTLKPDCRYVIAEGLFADELAERLKADGLLAAAYCVSQGRWRTFARRLRRDLAERRKPPMILLRRGLALAQAEPLVIARANDNGCRCLNSAQAYGRLTDSILSAQTS